MTYSDKEIRSVVERIQQLPTLPKVGMTILEFASDPEISMEELSRSIHQDPSLAARVLKVANSPFYGMSRQVDSLRLALVILGLNEVRNIAIGITIFNVIRDLSSNVTYDREKFWIHSAGCGVVARIIGRKLSLGGEGTDFIAGLLHDMGKIIIDEYFGDDFKLIFEKTRTYGIPMLEAERAVLGESHEHIGQWLAEKWRLPETLCEAIFYHHESPSPESCAAVKAPDLVALSYIAEAFCDRYEIGWDGDSGYNDLKNRKVWEVLLSQQDEYTIDDVDTLLAETYQAFRQARPYLLL